MKPFLPYNEAVTETYQSIGQGASLAIALVGVLLVAWHLIGHRKSQSLDPERRAVFAALDGKHRSELAQGRKVRADDGRGGVCHGCFRLGAGNESMHPKKER